MPAIAIWPASPLLCGQFTRNNKDSGSMMESTTLKRSSNTVKGSAYCTPMRAPMKPLLQRMTKRAGANA
jgi:hypothetical protein